MFILAQCKELKWVKSQQKLP